MQCQDCLLSKPKWVRYYNWFERDYIVYICPYQRIEKEWGEECDHEKERKNTLEYDGEEEMEYDLRD